ncbi:MAG: NADH-dependent [FeFe] hydrogenase, group A6 [Bacillota bacterium]|jgi:NADH-quinone oxidoreductase subunit G|nr:NADH-dependent [FeFe] hydrogenase, group A6 [Bacillota bacterium]
MNITINGLPVEVQEGDTILKAARKLGIHIPTLCYMNLEALHVNNQASSCRICMVEVEGRPNLVTACSELVKDGMVVTTNSPRAVNARRINLELILSNHPPDCLVCAKNKQCDLQSLAQEMHIFELPFQGEKIDHPTDKSSRALEKYPNKCIMCRRCETMCNTVQTVGVLSALNRGFDAVVGPAFHLPMNETSCTFCGQCVAVCPTGALVAVDHTEDVWRALQNPDKHVVAQVAPAVRVAIGEMFGMEPGSVTTGKIPTALRRLGFDAVFDTDFAADLTIMEEAAELVHRIQHDGVLPILTSCCPAWVRFIETNYPDMLEIPSTCKSPQMMLGAMAKTYYAKQTGIDPEKIVVVSVMPCIAKKEEAERPELSNSDMHDVDLVMSTREFAYMMQYTGIEFDKLEESEFDSLMGESTGAAVIFGTTGGVIEAAVRTAYEWVTGETLEKVEFEQLRGLDGIRSGKVQVGDLELNIGIAHGLGNARKLLDGVRDGTYDFQAIEIMACPGGCIGGGGQPYHHGNEEVLKKRQAAIYAEDRSKTLRKSHDNPMIKKIYDEYLGEPYGELPHLLLHTDYSPKKKI